MSAATETEVDVLIVGAGPVGLFGAYYAGFRELRVALVDALPEVGGQISAMYPEKDLLDITGFPAVKGRDLVARLVAQADRFSPLYLLGHDTFRAHAHTITSVRDAGVPILTRAQVTRVLGDVHVEAVEVTVDGEESPRRLECQRLVAALGFTANLGPLRSWGLDIANNRHIVVDSAMRTNQPGIFAAGDITDYDGKVRLVAVGFGEVALAVNNAAVHIDPSQALFPGHSTDAAREVPQPVGAT